MTERMVRVPAELVGQAEKAARESGFTLDEFIAMLLANQFADQTRAEELFRTRAARANPARALEILARAGKDREPRPDDRIDAL